MHDTTDDIVASENTEQSDALTSYTAPCRTCGQRLFLLEEEVLTCLTTPPLCWQCATAARTD